jgi:methionine synthase II (cobalamin-independent)
MHTWLRDRGIHAVSPSTQAGGWPPMWAEVVNKTPVLETTEALRRRIEEAAAFVDAGNLALSPQCGFASIAEGGNRLSANDHFAKLRLVADTARAM